MVLDVETTGLSPTGNRIVEVALVTTDIYGRIIEEWTTRLNPQGPIGATHIHGISAADVANAPVFGDVIDSIISRLDGAAVAAHNAKFDLAFLRAEFARAGWRMPLVPALCTLEASDHHLPHLERRRLADCCWAIGEPLSNAHSALFDARAAASLLAAYMHPHVGPAARPGDRGLPAEAWAVKWPTSREESPVHLPVAGVRRRSAVEVARVRRKTATAPASAPLVQLVERFSLTDALDEGAPLNVAGALAYLEKIAEVVEDGVLTNAEAADLAEVAAVQELSPTDVATCHQAFVQVLAHAALADGKVTRNERTELEAMADVLAVDPRVLPALLDKAEAARNARLADGLKDLPTDWPHGEPLRVGDKVAFTGCDPIQREKLEKTSEHYGVRVLNSISGQTAILVTDSTMNGTKLAKARQVGTRIVHPDVYEVMLKHLQPAKTPDARAVARTSAPAFAAASGTASGPESTVSPSAAGAVAPAPARVRAWAKANGWEVGVRGRLQTELLEAYAVAHARTDTGPASAGGAGTLSASALGFHDGRHYTEWVDTVRQLKREHRNDDAVVLLWNLVDAVEAEAVVKKWRVAPWYYEQLAILARKRGDVAGEVAVLERYAEQMKAPGSGSAKLAARLRTARNRLDTRDL